MPFNDSPNMNLPIPTVGSEPGPNYANDVNNSLSLIDQHDHSSGSGVRVNPSGLNINADLPFGTNNATLLRSARFVAQTSPLSGTADLTCIYSSIVSSNGELFYNDSAGRQVQITSAGSVNATSSGISNGTVQAIFNASNQLAVSFISSGLPAAAVLGPLFLQNSSSSTFAMEVQAPTLTSNENLVLPLPPPSHTEFVTIDTSGNMGTANSVSAAQIAGGSITGSQLASNAGITGGQIATNTITQSNMNILKPQVGNTSFSQTSSGTFATTWTGTKTITTTGGAVFVGVSGGTLTSAVSGGTGTQITANVLINNSTQSNRLAIAAREVFLFAGGAGGTDAIPVNIWAVDTNIVGTPGTYTYTVGTSVTQNTTSQSVSYTGSGELTVFEL